MNKPLYLFQSHLRQGEFREALAVYELHLLSGHEPWTDSHLAGHSPYVSSVIDLFDEAVRESIYSCTLFDDKEKHVMIRENPERVDDLAKKNLETILTLYAQNRNVDKYVVACETERNHLDNYGLRLWTIANYLHKIVFDNKDIKLLSGEKVNPQTVISSINTAFELSLKQYITTTLQSARQEAKTYSPPYSRLLASQQQELYLSLKGYMNHPADF